MADSPVEQGRDRSAGSGLSCDSSFPSRCVWALWKSGSSAHAEVRSHPLGYQLCVHMDGNLLFTSVHVTREDAEREARALKQGALAEGWIDPKDPVAGGLDLASAAGARPEG